MNAILNYPGAKWGLAQEIVALMPTHHSYLEPFFGTGAVFFNKPPSSIETINDLDGDVVNFFRVLRAEPERLAREIALTPYARDVFDDAFENKGDSDFERAYRFCIRSRMGHGFKTRTNTGFKIDVFGRESNYCVSQWNATPARLLEAVQRLKEVQIENRSAVDLIRRYNHDNVLIYADPPYLLQTRGGKLYQCEMSDTDHEELLEALLQHKGKVMLSGYRSGMYDSALRGWKSVEWKTRNQNAASRTEVLWCNFELPQMRLEDYITKEGT